MDFLRPNWDFFTDFLYLQYNKERCSKVDKGGGWRVMQLFSRLFRDQNNADWGSGEGMLGI